MITHESLFEHIWLRLEYKIQAYVNSLAEEKVMFIKQQQQHIDTQTHTLLNKEYHWNYGTKLSPQQLDIGL